MAAKPIERFVKKQIQDQGGWPRILERIASGESISHVSSTFLRPDGVSISFAFFSRLLHQDPEREAPLAEAKRLRAEAWADEALRVSDEAIPSRDDIAKAKLRIETRLRLASLADRAQYGESRPEVSVTVNLASLHVDALRHREVVMPAATPDLLQEPAA